MEISLFDQVKDLNIKGARLSGEPEILHEIQDYFRTVELYPVTREQIRKILECVPAIFPEGWASPEDYNGLNESQQEAYVEIGDAGVVRCIGPVIQKTVELALELRETNST